MARDFNILKNTLQRYVVKSKDVNWEEDLSGKNLLLKPNYSVHQIFMAVEEDMFTKYLSQSSDLHHELPPKKARKLAYECAVVLN